MSFKRVVGFVVALAAVGADALVCRPGSSSVAFSSALTTSTSILETSSTATVSASEESIASTTTETTVSATTSIASLSTEEPTSASSTTSIIISTTAESTSASTTVEATTTTSISTTEKPTSSTVIATTSTTSSEPASCPTEGLVCGDDGHVPPRPGLKYIRLGVISVEACNAACLEVADCAFFLINRGSKVCTLFRMSKQEAGLRTVPTADSHVYERGCFVC